MPRNWGYDALFFAAILTTLFSLAPGLAHLFELPHKIHLSRDAYFTVQQIYSGWNLFGIVLAAQLIALVALCWRSRRHPGILALVGIALLGLIAAQALFWGYTFPANGLTHNWTQIPADWQAVRRSWEYSHAAGAICQFLGFVSLVLALIARARGR